MPGVPDLIVIRNGMPFGLELKAQGGRLSEAQTEALEAMRAAGADVGVTHGEVIGCLRRELGFGHPLIVA